MPSWYPSSQHKTQLGVGRVTSFTCEVKAPESCASMTCFCRAKSPHNQEVLQLHCTVFMSSLKSTLFPSDLERSHRPARDSGHAAGSLRSGAQGSSLPESHGYSTLSPGGGGRGQREGQGAVLSVLVFVIFRQTLWGQWPWDPEAKSGSPQPLLSPPMSSCFFLWPLPPPAPLFSCLPVLCPGTCECNLIWK